MAQLPLQHTSIQDLSLLETRWKALLDPMLANPANNSSILNAVTLKTGFNTINHLLGRALQGWIVIGNNASTTFYDNQANNPQPQSTLILHSSGVCKINLLVF